MATLSPTKMRELEKALAEANAHARTRKLSLDQAVQAIEEAAKAVKQANPNFRTAITFKYLPHWVAKAYNYPAEGTGLWVMFNKSGTVKKVKAGRWGVQNRPTNRLDLDIDKITKWLDQRGVTDGEIRRIVLKESGFVNWMRQL